MIELVGDFPKSMSTLSEHGNNTGSGSSRQVIPKHQATTDATTDTISRTNIGVSSDARGTDISSSGPGFQSFSTDVASNTNVHKIETNNSIHANANNSSNRCQEYFNKAGSTLLHIQNLKYWALDRVLVDKYKFTQSDATAVAEFLLPMLQV